MMDLGETHLLVVARDHPARRMLAGCAAISSSNEARFFTGPLQHRVVPLIGHNTPQEAPAAVAEAHPAARTTAATAMPVMTASKSLRVSSITEPAAAMASMAAAPSRTTIGSTVALTTEPGNASGIRLGRVDAR
jgi:hypothetical protein